MAQAQNVSANAVSGLQPLSYLNQNQPATVLFVRQKRAPTPNDKRFKFGTLWLDTAEDSVYALINVANNQAFWILLGKGTGRTHFPITPFVVGPSDEADFLTIQEAIDASMSSTNQNGTIYIQPGIYSENLTFHNKISLVSIVDSVQDAVQILGTHTPDPFGAMSIRGCTLAGGLAIFQSTIAGSGEISLEECFISVLSGWTYDVINWTGDLWIKNCKSSGNSDGVFNNTGGARVFVENSQMGQGVSKTLTANGDTFLSHSILECPINLSGGDNLIAHSSLGRPATFSGNAAILATYSAFFGGLQSAITLTTAVPATLLNCTLQADVTVNALEGTSTVTVSNVTFIESDGIDGNLTLSDDPEVKAASFATVTSSQNSGMKLKSTTISAQGGSPNIDINLAPKATGDVRINPGSLILTALGAGIRIKEGVNARMGTATLVAGLSVVANTSITATTRIFLTHQLPGGAPGTLFVAARAAGASFSIGSSSGADNGTVGWELIEPA